MVSYQQRCECISSYAAAKLAISIARKLGALIFLVPEGMSPEVESEALC